MFKSRKEKEYCHNGTLYSNENEQITTACNNIYDSHKRVSEPKKSHIIQVIIPFTLTSKTGNLTYDFRSQESGYP